SATNARGWRAALGRVDVVHNGIDLSLWRPGIGGGGFAVWTGRITPEKGLDIAIDACRTAGVELRIAGPISDRDHFEDKIVPRLGLDVQYLGHLPHRDLARLQRACDVFVTRLAGPNRSASSVSRPWRAEPPWPRFPWARPGRSSAAKEASSPPRTTAPDWPTPSFARATSIGALSGRAPSASRASAWSTRTSTISPISPSSDGAAPSASVAPC